MAGNLQIHPGLTMSKWVLCLLLLLRAAARSNASGGDDNNGDDFKCSGNAQALAVLQSIPQSITFGNATWGLHFAATNASAIPPFLAGPDNANATALARGTIFIPHKHVAPEAYAPYAIGSAARARYTVITAYTDASLVSAAIAANPTIFTWVLVAHGSEAGNVAAAVAAAQGVSVVTGLAFLASELPETTSVFATNLGAYLFFGGNDTETPPSAIPAFASNISGDSFVNANVANANHYDFAYSTCVANKANDKQNSPEDVAAQAARSSLVGGIIQASLLPMLRFHPWTFPTARALTYGDNGNLTPGSPGSKTYPTDPPNLVTFSTLPYPGLTSTDPPRTLNVFTPATVKGGFVYMPGTRISARSYFPMAFELSSRGYLVVVFDIPARHSSTVDFVLSDIVADVNGIIDSSAFSGVQHWAVGGHSRGAIASTVYGAAFASVSSKVFALVLQNAGGNANGNLTTSPLPVLALYGSLDKNPGPVNFNPNTTQFIKVQGANHDNVGDYDFVVLPPGQINATIPIDQQHTIYAQQSVTFMDTHLPV